ncbi:MAG: hypothetical protein IKX65_03915 [Prevotella sp.]|nr:hypothetical protein [Prevotella sp.]
MAFESSFKAIDNTLHYNNGCGKALEGIMAQIMGDLWEDNNGEPSLFGD